MPAEITGLFTLEELLATLPAERRALARWLVGAGRIVPQSYGRSGEPLFSKAAFLAALDHAIRQRGADANSSGGWIQLRAGRNGSGAKAVPNRIDPNSNEGKALRDKQRWDEWRDRDKPDGKKPSKKGTKAKLIVPSGKLWKSLWDLFGALVRAKIIFASGTTQVGFLFDTSGKVLVLSLPPPPRLALPSVLVESCGTGGPVWWKFLIAPPKSAIGNGASHSPGSDSAPAADSSLAGMLVVPRIDTVDTITQFAGVLKGAAIYYTSGADAPGFKFGSSPRKQAKGGSSTVAASLALPDPIFGLKTVDLRVPIGNGRCGVYSFVLADLDRGSGKSADNSAAPPVTNVLDNALVVPTGETWNVVPDYQDMLSRSAVSYATSGPVGFEFKDIVRRFDIRLPVPPIGARVVDVEACDVNGNVGVYNLFVAE